MKTIISILFVFISISTFSIGNVSIKKLKDAPDKYKGKEISIKGEVVKSSSVFLQSGYIIKDKTGEIFVVTSGKLPPKKEKTITLKGKIVIIASMNDKNMVLFKETPEKKKE